MSILTTCYLLLVIFQSKMCPGWYSNPELLALIGNSLPIELSGWNLVQHNIWLATYFCNELYFVIWNNFTEETTGKENPIHYG